MNVWCKRTGRTPLIAISMALVALGGLVVFINLPFNPNITVTFKVATTSGYSITVGPSSYMKATFLGSVGVPASRIFLSHLDTNGGPYSLSIAVRYGTNTLSVQNFTMIGDGGYQMKVLYESSSESTTIPYTITMTLLSASLQPLTTSTVTVFPT